MDDGRVGMLVWAFVVLTWVAAYVILGRSALAVTDRGLGVGDSLVERFGLFVIIVLGEVVVGVVDGLRSAEREPQTIATGLIALVIGFGLWWNYFDLTARRLPRNDSTGAPMWITLHLPLTMSIAAAGAAMVVVVEHATEPRVPISAGWLLSAAVALGLLSLAMIVRTLADYEVLTIVFEPTSRVMLVGAVVALIIGFARPASIVFVLALAAIHAVIWAYAVSLWLKTEEAARTLDT